MYENSTVVDDLVSPYGVIREEKQKHQVVE